MSQYKVPLHPAHYSVEVLTTWLGRLPVDSVAVLKIDILFYFAYRIFLMRPFDIPYMDLAGPDCKYLKGKQSQTCMGILYGYFERKMYEN